MALTKTLWTTIVDLVSTGQNVSDNLDIAFTNIDDAMTQVDTNEINIATNTADITTLQAADSAISITSVVKATQTVVADTATKLDWMTTALVDNGGTAISYNIPTSHITILEAGTYRVFGVITLVAPNNDVVEIELYVDNLPTGFIVSSIGKGSLSRVAFSYSTLAPFIANDDITLHVTSTGTEVTLQSSSVTIEATKY